MISSYSRFYSLLGSVLLAGCSVTTLDLDQPADASYIVKQNADQFADCVYVELKKTNYDIGQARLNSLHVIEVTGSTTGVKHFVVAVKQTTGGGSQVEFRIRPYSRATGLSPDWLRRQTSKCF